MSSSQIIALVPLIFIAACTIVSWRSFRLNFPGQLKLLSIAWTIMFLVEITGHITGYFNIRNQWLYNALFFCWYPLLAMSFYYQFTNPVIRKTITGFCILFPILFLIKVLFFRDNYGLQTLIFVIGGSYIILLSILYFRQLYLSEDNEQITRDPYFWFSAGFLLYFGGNVPFLGMYNYLDANYPGFLRFWGLYFSNAFIILLNIFVTVGFLCRTIYRK